MILSKIKRMDYSLITSILLLSGFGLVMVYSSSYTLGAMEYNDGSHFFFRQLQWLLVGVLFFIPAALIPYKVYGKLSPIFVIISIVLLVLVLIPGIGVERNNSQRWIAIGPFLFQPVEAVKLFMIIYFAYIFAKKQSYINQFSKAVLPPLLILALTFLLIMQQPDLGSSMLILLVCGIIVLCSGARPLHIFLLGSGALLAFGYFAYTSSYRLERLTSFLNVFEDPQGSGYQLVNSYVAIATGGLWGNGLGGSVQKLGFLPEAHTDFIMAVILEEIGVFGLLIVISLYLFMMFRGFSIAKDLDDMFPKLLAIGLTFQITLQAVINLGAVSGMLPITGITLPFISYGGSSLLFTMISAGILVNLSAYRNRMAS
ncbi:putative lipid II flippase FtsW [Virgibacillus kimchii]